MNPNCQLISVLVLGVFALVFTDESFQSFVDRYQSWYNRRNQEAAEYEYPKDARMHEADDKVPKEYGNYDFIIVGAGSTGCVIANRLSENPNWKILVLEAGTFRDDDLSEIPAWGGLNVFTKFNWGFQTTPQQHAFLGNTDRKALLSRGKGVGGTSLINGLAYSRGHKRDYDRWSELLNDPDWNYKNILPFFRKSETFTGTNPFLPIDEEYHGHAGPLSVTQTSPPENLATVTLAGGQEWGHNLTDYNGREQQGFAVIQYTIRNGRRVDPDHAFIFPVIRRKNLNILEGSYVTRVVFQRNTNKAIGVMFTRNNRTFIARCSKEVILSAGAINSPQILMLSGIGPEDHLRSLKIPVIKNLPVGNNLLDHPMTFLIFSSNVTIGTESFADSLRDFSRGGGSFTRPQFSDAIGLFTTSVEDTENYSDIEIIYTNITRSDLSTKGYGFSEDTLRALRPTNAQTVFSLQIFNLNQKSVGTLRLKSSDPFEYPLIDLNLLSDENNTDIETLHQGIKMSLDFMQTSSLRRMNISLAIDRFPGCNHLEPLSRDYWYCYIRMVTATGQHLVGTCSTGRNPSSGVVDNKLRVFGTSGLRVADASVIPLSTRAHINAPCTMIGEKASDLIKQQYIRTHSKL